MVFGLLGILFLLSTNFRESVRTNIEIMVFYRGECENFGGIFRSSQFCSTASCHLNRPKTGSMPSVGLRLGVPYPIFLSLELAQHVFGLCLVFCMCACNRHPWIQWWKTSTSPLHSNFLELSSVTYTLCLYLSSRHSMSTMWYISLCLNLIMFGPSLISKKAKAPGGVSYALFGGPLVRLPS